MYERKRKGRKKNVELGGEREGKVKCECCISVIGSLGERDSHRGSECKHFVGKESL